MATVPPTVRSRRASSRSGIHDFSSKLLQPALFDNLLAYVRWQIAVREGRACPPPTFAPISINLDLTAACNHYCHHCIDLDVLNTGKLLSQACVHELIDELAAGGLRSVIVIGGGEPTLHPQFVDVIGYLKRQGLAVGIVSNGVRTEPLIEAAARLEAGDWLRLSLDAASDDAFAEIHNSKSPRTLTEILHDVRRLREENPDLQLGYSYLAIPAGGPLHGNVHEIPAAARLARAHGFSYLSVKPVIDRAARETVPDSVFVQALAEQMAAAKRYETPDFRVVESLNLTVLLEGTQRELRRQPKTCHANFFRVVATPDGVFSCPIWRGFDAARLTPEPGAGAASMLAGFARNRPRNLAEFDASETCARVACIYNGLNWFVEELIENPERLDQLEAAVDRRDFFL